MSGRYKTPLVQNLMATFYDHRKNEMVTVTYQVNLDSISLGQMVERAYKNKSRKATCGPLQAVIEKVK